MEETEDSDDEEEAPDNHGADYAFEILIEGSEAVGVPDAPEADKAAGAVGIVHTTTSCMHHIPEPAHLVGRP